MGGWELQGLLTPTYSSPILTPRQHIASSGGPPTGSSRLKPSEQLPTRQVGIPTEVDLVQRALEEYLGPFTTIPPPQVKPGVRSLPNIVSQEELAAEEEERLHEEDCNDPTAVLTGGGVLRRVRTHWSEHLASAPTPVRPEVAMEGVFGSGPRYLTSDHNLDPIHVDFAEEKVHRWISMSYARRAPAAENRWGMEQRSVLPAFVTSKARNKGF